MARGRHNASVGTVQVAGRTLEARSGDAFIIPAGTISYYESSREDPWDYAWVGFLGLNARQYLRSLTRTSQSRYVLHGIDAKSCYATIQRALPLDPSSPAASLRSNAILFELLASLVEGVGADVQGKSESDVAEAARLIIEMEFGDHLFVSDIAARVGVHPNYLSKRFSSAFGMSPKRFLTQVRLERARRLVHETDANIGTIARSVGFDDALAFSKVFSKSYGMPPTKYRACRRPKNEET